MPDFGNPVADQITAPNPNQSIQTLSGVMALKNQQQNLQIGQQQLQSGAADVQMKQQSAAQRQGIANIDWSKYADDTGMVSTDKMLGDPSLRAASGDQFLDVMKTAAGIRTQQLQNKQSLVNLNDGLRNQFGSIVSALRTDPDVVNDTPAGRQKVTDAVNAFGAAGGPDAQRVAEIYGPQVEHVPQGQLARGLSTVQLQAMDASRQAAAQTPQYVNTGATLTNTNPQAAGGNLAGSPAIQNTLSPESAAQRVPTYSNGQPGTVSLGSVTPGAQGYGSNAFGSGRYGSQPGQNPTFAATGAPIGTGADVDWMKHDYQNVQAEATSAQQRIGLYNNVQQLSKQALTGPQDRLSYANSLLALVGVPKAESLNDAQVALNKNAAMIQQAFGGNTDAARAVVQHFTPGTAMPDKVNQEISEYGKAVGQMQQFAQKYLQEPSNGTDPAAYKTAKANLSLVADPRMWEFQNKSPSDRVEMLRTMTPQQRAQFGELYKRAAGIGAFQ